MASGTFMTGLEISDPVPLKPQITESRTTKAEERSVIPPIKTNYSKTPKSIGAPSRILNSTKNDNLPSLQKIQTKSILKHSITETNFNKPVLKKIGNIKNIQERANTTAEEKKPDTFQIGRQSEAKKMTFFDAFEFAISKYISSLVYKFREFDQLNMSKKQMETLEEMTKKRHFNVELEKEQEKLQKEMKKYNDMVYEIKKKKEMLEQLEKKDRDLELQLQDCGNLFNDKEKMISDVENQIEEEHDKLNWNEYEMECLTRMRQNKKEAVVASKKHVVDKKDDIKEKAFKFETGRKEIFNIGLATKRIAALVQKYSKKLSTGDGNIDQEFEDALADEMSEFEDKRKLKEILKFEQHAIEENDRRKEEEERRRRQERISEEQKKYQKEGEKLRKERQILEKKKEEFEEFRKVTSVSTLADLETRLDELTENIKEMEVSNATLEAEKDDKLRELHQLIDQYNALKFEKERPPSSAKFPTDVKAEELEQMFLDRKNKITLLEQEVTRLNKLEFECCTNVSRILHQVQRGKSVQAVDTKSLITALSIVGLKLERMLTLVIKKRRTFFMESINTVLKQNIVFILQDGTIREGSENFPPKYMGIVYSDVRGDLDEQKSIPDLPSNVDNDPNHLEMEEVDNLRAIRLGIKSSKGDKK